MDTETVSRRRLKSPQIVTGFFVQDDPGADAKAIGGVSCLSIAFHAQLTCSYLCVQLPPRLGLLDESPQRWETFKAHIAELNTAATPGTQYKVFFFSRHGEGVREFHQGSSSTSSMSSTFAYRQRRRAQVWYHRGMRPCIASRHIGSHRSRPYGSGTSAHRSPSMSYGTNVC